MSLETLLIQTGRGSPPHAGTETGRANPVINIQSSTWGSVFVDFPFLIFGGDQFFGTTPASLVWRCSQRSANPRHLRENGKGGNFSKSGLARRLTRTLLVSTSCACQQSFPRERAFAQSETVDPNLGGPHQAHTKPKNLVLWDSGRHQMHKLSSAGTLLTLLMALWKAKSVRKAKSQGRVISYCVECLMPRYGVMATANDSGG